MGLINPAGWGFADCPPSNKDDRTIGGTVVARSNLLAMPPP
jgi:hypothetical protein